VVGEDGDDRGEKPKRDEAELVLGSFGPLAAEVTDDRRFGHPEDVDKQEHPIGQPATPRRLCR